MRGAKFHGGYHDVALQTGGLKVFPRLVATEPTCERTRQLVTTGVKELDELLGGGLMRGSSTLLLGPAGVGKSATAVSCVRAALERGEHAAYFLCGESASSLIERSAAVGMDLATYTQDGRLSLQQVDPAEMPPGELASHVRRAVEHDGAKVVVIDSLNAYLQAMPGASHLLHMHALLSYLNRQGVLTLVVLCQRGLVGDARADVDLGHLSDTILSFWYFEAHGELLTAIAAVKSRTHAHQRTIRRLTLGPHGLRVGAALADFVGVLSGTATARNAAPTLRATG
jgi:circadian clock protein KaiC